MQSVSKHSDTLVDRNSHGRVISKSEPVLSLQEQQTLFELLTASIKGETSAENALIYQELLSSIKKDISNLSFGTNSITELFQ